MSKVFSSSGKFPDKLLVYRNMQYTDKTLAATALTIPTVTSWYTATEHLLFVTETGNVYSLGSSTLLHV